MEDSDLETHPPTEASQRTEPVRARWAPRPEQILILESIFNSGMVNPPKHELVKIRELIEKYDPVMDANVYYWFQNRRSRSRRRKRMIQAMQLSQGGPSTSIQHDQSSSTSASHSSSSSGISSPPNGPIYDVGCDDLFSIARQMCSSTLITSHTTNAFQHDHSSSNLTLSSFSSAFVSPSHGAINDVGSNDLFSGTHQMAPLNLIAGHGTNAIQYDYGSSASALPSYSSNVISHSYEANHSIGSNDLFSITHQMGPPAQILGHTMDAIQHDHGSFAYISHSSSSSAISSPPYGAIHDIVGNDLFSITSQMGSLTPFMAQNMNAMQYDHGSCATPIPSFSSNIASSPYGDIHDIGRNDLFSIAHRMGPPTPVAAQYPGAIQDDHGSHVSSLPSSSLTIGSSHSYGAIHDTGRNDDLFSIAYQMCPPTLVAAQNPGAIQHDRRSLVSTSPSSLTIGSSHSHGAIHYTSRNDDLFSIAYQMCPPTLVAAQNPGAIQHDRRSLVSTSPSSLTIGSSHSHGAIHYTGRNDDLFSIAYQMCPPTLVAAQNPGAIQHDRRSLVSTSPSSLTIGSSHSHGAIHDANHNDDLFSIAYQMRPPTPVATQYPSAIQHDRGSSASAFPSSYSNVVSSPYGAIHDVDQNDPFPSIAHQISPPTPIAVHHPGAIQHGCSSSTFVIPLSSSSVVSFPYSEAIHNVGHNDLFTFTRP